MNRAIAEQAWALCSRQASKESALWYKARSEQQGEPHRLACADWATIAKMIYERWLKPEPAGEHTR